MDEFKTRKLKLVMNELNQDTKDPTKLHFTMSILDGNTSHNNVKVLNNGLQSLAKSVKGMPLVAKLIVDEEDRSNDDFGDHEVKISKDRNGQDFIDRETIAIGSFTNDGYLVKQVIDGEEVDVLMGDGVLWVSRYPDIVNLIKEMFDSGIKINTSSEYRYDYSKAYFDDDNVEIHDMDLYFEGTAVLGSDSKYVPPAYDYATFLSLNKKKTNEFNLLVAQALEKKEGEKYLELQTNKVSYYTIMDQAKNQVYESLEDKPKYIWVNDITNEDVIISTESEDYDVKYWQFKYTLENDEVKVDLSSGVEVKESRQWTQVTETMTNKISELESYKEGLEVELNSAKVEKLDLVEKLNKADELIVNLTNEVKLNKVTIEELTPFKEQVELNAKKELIEKAKVEFEAKFMSVEGEEQFNSEEVQELVVNSIVEGEVGLNAKLQLSNMIIDLASKKLEKSNPLDMITNSKKQRDFSSLIVKEDDILADLK